MICVCQTHNQLVSVIYIYMQLISMWSSTKKYSPQHLCNKSFWVGSRVKLLALIISQFVQLEARLFLFILLNCQPNTLDYIQELTKLMSMPIYSYLRGTLSSTEKILSPLPPLSLDPWVLEKGSCIMKMSLVACAFDFAQLDEQILLHVLRYCLPSP